MKHSRWSCPRCGDIPDAGANACESCGILITDEDFGRNSAGGTPFHDTVCLPAIAGEVVEERVVPPALAVLFRLAVGPAADYYAPRFFKYERIGRSLPSWNWAAPWAPSIWAFHHKLWGAGLAFALWPIATMAAFNVIDPHLGDSILTSLACAVVLLWLVPGVVAALTANSLLYRKTRHIVRNVEAETRRPSETARRLAELSPIAPGFAVLVGGLATLFALFIAVPNLQTAVADRVVRTRVAEVLEALHPLEREVEQGWGIVKSSRIAPNYEIFGRQRSTDLLAAVNVNPESGRVRLALGPSIPEIAGRWILLAPALDRSERVRWVCVPVDIPTRYLPQACRQG